MSRYSISYKRQLCWSLFRLFSVYFEQITQRLYHFIWIHDLLFPPNPFISVPFVEVRNIASIPYPCLICTRKSWRNFLASRSRNCWRIIPTTGDASQLLPLKDESFDILLDRGCLTQISHKDLNSVMAEIHRVLKPNGRFFSFTLFGSNS